MLKFRAQAFYILPAFLAGLGSMTVRVVVHIRGILAMMIW